MIDELPSVVLPPPEPEPGRAPRPLVSEEDDLEEMVEAATPGGESEQAAGTPGEVDTMANPEVAGEGELESSPMEVGRLPSDAEPGVDASISLAEPEVETLIQEAPNPSEAAEPQAIVEPEPRSRLGGAGARREPAPEPDHAGEPGVDVGRVVVMEGEADGLAVPDSAPHEPEPEATPRKRWSLFRRGGDR
jgi:hypothetical protein